MKIKITKPSNSRFWYDTKVGEIFLVRRIDSDRYWVKENNEYSGWNYILFEHCETVKEN